MTTQAAILATTSPTNAGPTPLGKGKEDKNMFTSEAGESVEREQTPTSTDFLIAEVLAGDEFALLRETLGIYQNLVVGEEALFEA